MKRYTIANLNISVHGGEFGGFDRRMSGYASSFDGQAADVQIRCCDSDGITLPDGKTLKRIHRWQWIETAGDGYAAFQTLPGSDTVVSLLEVDREWKNARLQLRGFENNLGITNELRRYLTAGEIFSYAVLQHDGLILHASAIDYDGGAILFSAPSGTGKSTHTSLWNTHYGGKTRVLNDDSPAIRFTDGKAYAFGTPWSGKTTLNLNRAAPLRAIVCLERGERNSIKRIDAKTAAPLLLNETRKPVYTEMMGLTLGVMQRLIAETPMYLLSCNVSKEAVDVVKTALGV
ncbi:MAG: hypothetical protein LBH54_05440 [Clostridiales bacterium]|nr:hypothetical protein [Clostridiales bacterium]